MHYTVVFYLKSSSNHNYVCGTRENKLLYSILNHHQTTTPVSCLIVSFALYSILNHHQTTTILLWLLNLFGWGLYSILNHHQTTTKMLKTRQKRLLYSILNHHQTTTSKRLLNSAIELYSILNHHQTTTILNIYLYIICCILS